MSVRALIVDDEPAARSRLSRMLAEFPDVEIVGEAADGLSALGAIVKNKPDLVFLDIEMPELNGIEVAKTLGNDGPMIIFATAFDEHAVAAFETAAIDYLVKPLSKDRLRAAVERAVARKGEAHSVAHSLNQLPPAVAASSQLAVRCGARFVVFKCAEVSAILSQDHYSTLIIGEREVLSEESLDRLAARLGRDRFFRAHRSAVINLDYLSELVRAGDRKFQAVLSDQRKTRVAIARNRLPEIKRHLGIA